MLRRRPLRRFSPLRRQAARRSGLSKTERLHLNDLARACVMIRHGAVQMSHATGKGSGWYGRCAKCLKERWLQWSHIEPQGRVPSLIWDTDNAAALCWHCHNSWWHTHPREAEEWIIAKLGAGARAALAFRARFGRQKPDYELIRLSLEHELASLTHGRTPTIRFREG